MLIKLIIVSTDKLRCVSMISTPALFTIIERSYLFSSGKMSVQFYLWPYFIRSATMYYTLIEGYCPFSSDWANFSFDYVLAINRMFKPYFANSFAISRPIPLQFIGCTFRRTSYKSPCPLSISLFQVKSLSEQQFHKTGKYSVKIR